MPELPEVERARTLVEDYCKKKIAECVVQEQGGGPRTGKRDDIIFPNDTAEANVVIHSHFPNDTAEANVAIHSHFDHACDAGVA